MISAIKQKKSNCKKCGMFGPVISNLCKVCYWTGVKVKSFNKPDANDTIEEDGIPELIGKADYIFSKYIRLKAANGKTEYKCFICGKETSFSKGQNMHFIKRENLYLRYDERNCKAGCKSCNEFKGGNYLMYINKLEKEQPGITEILMQESRIVYKPTRSEMQLIIKGYTNKLKEIELVKEAI